MSDDPMLDRLLASHRSAVGARPSADHPDIDTLSRYATNQLSGAKAKEVAAHLVACDDGRCVAFVRSQAEDASATAGMLYPGNEETPARARTFQCKAGLWDTFVRIAAEGGVSIDELLEEAMTDYAKARGAIDAPTDPRRLPPEIRQNVEAARGDAADPEETLGATSARAVMTSAPPMQALASPAAPRSMKLPTPPPGTVRMPNRPARPPQAVPAARLASMPPVPSAAPAAPPPRAAAMPAPPARGLGAPPPPAPGRGAARPAPPPAASLPPGMPRSMPPLPGAASAPGMPMSTMKSARAALPTLTLTYQGRSYVVDKEKYVLGRSKTGADLRLDDANVSRQHAMIERVGGAYYIVDLGSTNGVFVGGERVARRPLRDGDVIEITTHTILCTLA